MTNQRALTIRLSRSADDRRPVAQLAVHRDRPGARVSKIVPDATVGLTEPGRGTTELATNSRRGESSPFRCQRSVTTIEFMPTQHDFRSAAGALRTLAATAGSSAVAVNDVHPDVGMDGGTATAIIDAAMNAAFLNANAVKTASDSAADEFDRRAEACAEYTRLMQQWRSDMEHWQGRWVSYMSTLAVDPTATGPGYQPQQPRRWPHWVEEG